MSEHHPLNSDICHVVNDQVMTLMKNTITHVPHVVWMDGQSRCPPAIFYPCSESSQANDSERQSDVDRERGAAVMKFLFLSPSWSEGLINQVEKSISTSPLNYHWHAKDQQQTMFSMTLDFCSCNWEKIFLHFLKNLFSGPAGENCECDHLVN